MKDYELLHRRKCPFCDRPFIDVMKYTKHVADCRDVAQRRLDEQWFNKDKS